MRTYKDLKVWRAGYSLALDLHREVHGFPVEERFGMSVHLRRTAVSIIVNIAEGAGRRTVGEHMQFLNIAAGSASELECQITLAADLHYIPAERAADYLARISEIRRMLHGMMKAIGRRASKPMPRAGKRATPDA